MTAFTGLLSEAYALWTQSISQCCGASSAAASARSHQEHPRAGAEKSLDIIRDEPRRVAPPLAMPSHQPSQSAARVPVAPRKRRGSGRSSFSVTKRLLRRSSSSRRPQISAPSNFCVVHSETRRYFDVFDQSLSGLPQTTSPEMPSSSYRPRRGQRRDSGSFRPLRLGLSAQGEQLSPILPHFDRPSPPVTPPPRALARSSPSSDGRSIVRGRSDSTMSFHIPRRPVPGGSVFESPRSDASSRRTPPRHPGRARSHTATSSSPSMMDDLVQRVALAMDERDKLQEQLDDVIERQSIHLGSRPSTVYGSYDMEEPMPDIPARPAKAPSFRERLSSDRPSSSASKPPSRSHYPANSSRKIEGRALPPPLPLKLRPPLRKKKSFSHVSSWLMNGGGHQRDISLDSITNMPKPTTGADGFYTVAPGAPASRRSSVDTASDVSDWSAAEEQTAPTSWSPSSEATIKALAEPPSLDAPYNPLSPPPKRRSVGIAF